MFSYTNYIAMNLVVQVVCQAQRLVVVQNDSEKEKMRSALGSAIMMEKPNVKVSQLPETPAAVLSSLLFCFSTDRPDLSFDDKVRIEPYFGIDHKGPKI